ncbi:cold shock domain-containing protein [uncultured Winogradskyella sp.]|uniref:cold-shock protein n=1 Tax=uncultured Winogradskyella sp. TaxID=395353 RepID=UPI00262A150B|nr:cold shock domain-containing protein [uncultured Winogradskyella sp.]
MLKLLRKLFKTNKTSDKKEGTVKFFNYTKGFGFITVKDSDEEIFVHKSNLKTKIKQGQNVTFNIEQSKKGPVAVNVSKLV